MSEQTLIDVTNGYEKLNEYLQMIDAKSILLVHDDAFKYLKIKQYFETIRSMQIIHFCDFNPNPQYESVVKGVNILCEHNCDTIIAVGGGSAIDVAKCIKLFFGMDNGVNFLEQQTVPNNINLIAMPTTAGTGSEATRFAVIYYHGEKQSVSDYSCIPSAVIMDYSSLETLPIYQKKSTMLDAFCHAVEAFWSVNSTEESKHYSKEAIHLIMDNMTSYLKNDKNGNRNMMKAANLAGKAINITQTTAGHAMCYKLTSLYGISHGHAAALCLSKLWPYMINNTDKCVDLRGEKYLKSIFKDLAHEMGKKDPQDAAFEFDQIIKCLDLPVPRPKSSDFEILKKSVNPTRLKNNPIKLTIETIDYLYHEILKEQI